MRFDIGNMQASVWQTEEAVDLKRLELQCADDERLEETLARSLAALESLLAIQRQTLDLLVRQDRPPTGMQPAPPCSPCSRP